MTAVFALDDLTQLARIGEIAVVREADSIRSVDVERLGFRSVVASRGGIAHVAHAHVALELLHVVLLEDIAHEAPPLAREELAIQNRCNARRVLAAMLQHRERIVDPLIDSTGTDDSGYAAHSGEFLRLRARVWMLRGARACLQRSRATRRRRLPHMGAISNF